jgi:hypothetical protein
MSRGGRSDSVSGPFHATGGVLPLLAAAAPARSAEDSRVIAGLFPLLVYLF